MATLKNYKKIGPTFTNGEECVTVEWDFANDAGATGVLDIFEAGSDVVITHFHSTVLTAATSGGSATLKVGITGDDDLFMTTTQGAVASLTLGAVVIPAVVDGTPNVIATPVKLASGAKVLQTIGTAAMTAGKVKYVIKYIKA
jgi:hypothetical protein